MKRPFTIIIFFVLLSHMSFSQVYLEQQTRHRFAQLNLGLSLETSFGGRTSYYGEQGNLSSINLRSTVSPKFIIGGTHFWGHADFYIAIPLLYNKQKQDNQEIQFFRRVETVMKYYPMKIKNRKIRPFIGFSIASFYYEQNNEYFNFKDGPELTKTSIPLLTGLTYNTKNYLLDLRLTWNYANKHQYHISRQQNETLTSPPLFVNLSYRYMLETTLSAEKDWATGKTQEITKKLEAQKRLNGFFMGIGISSIFWLNESSYNNIERPYIKKYTNSITPDFSLGYYLHQPDLNVVLGYRGYRGSTNSYGTTQHAKRNSLLLEVTKGLFDYHGFVPFIGPAVSYEKLNFQEVFEGKEKFDVKDNKIAYGLSFGWDIRPNRLQSWILRTNLRWYPNLSLEVKPNQQIAFDNLEFNFIQLIVYPNRMIKRKSNP